MDLPESCVELYTRQCVRSGIYDTNSGRYWHPIHFVNKGVFDILVTLFGEVPSESCVVFFRFLFFIINSFNPAFPKPA